MKLSEIKKVFWPIFAPVGLKRAYPLFKNKEFRLLDVGCGNNAPSKAKYWFPKVQYYGLDKQFYNLTVLDHKVMNKFYDIDLSCPGALSSVPDNYFEFINISHVIEHLHNGLEVIGALCKKLKNGGYIYIEYPAKRSLKLPSLRGTLNFFDDPSHIKLYSLPEIMALLKMNGISPLKFGTRRDFWLAALTFPHCIYSKLTRGYVSGGAFWDILGFAEFIFAKKGP